MENKKLCPLMFQIYNGQGYPQDYLCEEENCAWYCNWTESCAMVAIPAIINDK